MKLYKNKILPLFILFLLSSLALFVLPVSAVNYTSGFEDGTIGQSDYNNSWITTKKDGVNGEFMVSDDIAYSGSKSFEITYVNAEGNGNGWWNYTYSSNNVLSEWRIYIRTTNVGETDGYILLYDPTDPNFNYGNRYATTHIIIDFDTATDDVTYYNSAGAQTKIADFDDTSFHPLIIRYTATDSVTYTYANTTVSGTPRNIYNNIRITTCRLEPNFGSNGNGFYFDNHYIITGDGFGNAVSCGGFPNMQYTGKIHGGLFFNIDQPFVESQFDSPVSASFYYLDIDAGATQYNYDSNLNNYSAFLNDYALGTPTCFFDYMDTYILRWDFHNNPITLENQKPLIEIRHNSSNYEYETQIYDWCSDIFGNRWKCNYRTVTAYNYWFIGVSPDGSTDLDGDGDVQLKKNSLANDVGSYDGTIVNYDLSYRLYYDDIQTPSDVEEYADDYLVLSGYNTVLTDGTPVYYNKTNTVFISYFSSDMTAGNYLRIWHTDTGVEVGLTQGFGLGNVLKQSSSTRGFVPYNTGNYKTTLYRTGNNVSNETFYVEEVVDPNKILYTVPNPSIGVGTYEVYYGYTHPDGWKGAIGLSYNSNFNLKSECEYFLEEITSGSEGVFQWSTEDVQTHYWRLFTNVNNGTTYLPYGGIHKHYIFSDFITEDYITAQFPNLELAENYEDQRSQILTGTHKYLGADIWIRINDVPVISLSDEQVFEKFWRPRTTGLHHVTLEMNDNSTWILLDETNFTVSDTEDGTEAGDSILPNLGVTLGAIVGLIVTMFCTLSPLMITKGLKSKHSVPPIVYAFTCALGVVVSVQLSFFPFWIIPFIVIVGIIILTIQYLIHSGGSGGGDS